MKLKTLLILPLLLSPIACAELFDDEDEPQVAIATPANRPTPNPQPDTGTLDLDTEIMIGRSEVMHGQLIEGLLLLGVKSAGALQDEANAAHADNPPFQRLSDSVARYNKLRDLACAKKIVRGQICAEERYMPLWYAGRARPDVTPQALSKMAEDVQGQTVPLWSAVCAKASKKAHDDMFCAIE